jgi:hypothetical protein
VSADQSAQTTLTDQKVRLDQIPHEMLIAEFNYIAQSTNQSSEDRARVSNYYLVTLAGATAAIFGKGLINSSQPSMYLAIGIGLIALGSLGLFTLLSLIRLRTGWLDGVIAMNQIKNYYKCVYREAMLGDVFVWNKIPSAAKRDSVASWTAASVIVVDSAMFGLGAIFITSFWTTIPMDNSSLVFGGIVLGLVLIFQLALYFGLLARAEKQLRDQMLTKRDWNKTCPGDKANAPIP